MRIEFKKEKKEEIIERRKSSELTCKSDQHHLHWRQAKVRERKEQKEEVSNGRKPFDSWPKKSQQRKEKDS